MDKKNLTKTYTTDEIAIIWQPAKRIHAALCAKTLPRVYQPGEKPWINPERATTEELIEQIDGCPSSALSYEQKNKKRNYSPKSKENGKAKSCR